MAKIDFQGMRVLVVDDEPNILVIWRRILSRQGCEIKLLPDGSEAIDVIEKWDPDVMLIDVRMPKISGLDVLQEVKRRDLPTEVVIMTGFASVSSALEALKKGAYDYLTKPFDNIDDAMHTVLRAGRYKKLLSRLRELDESDAQFDDFEGLIGTSPEMKRVFETIEMVANSESSVLIQGESGTGKELVARAIFNRGPRKTSKFLAINCAALTDTLLESELFGHEKGAFTGAASTRKGLFEAADGGTLFLDEVGDIPLATQPKLLRVLQEGELKRVGGNEIRKVDVRVLAATNANLAENVKNGSFRSDLFYRLNVINIELPPLRERISDIYLLSISFIQKYAKQAGKDVDCIHPEAMGVFERYDWPGNVRELENVIERAVVLCQDREIGLKELSEKMRELVYEPWHGDEQITALPYQEAKDRSVSDFDHRYLTGTLIKSGGNISRAAKLAGMDRSSFRRLMKRYNIDAAKFSNESGE